jgi:SAM-dependent methyltransferase
MHRMNMYTDGSYLASNPSWHEEHSGWKADFAVQMMRKHGIAPTRVAEIGCGAGQILVELAAKMPAIAQLDGYEISPQAFARAATKASDRIAYHNVDILADPPAQPYDVAMAMDVFEHVDDYIGFIARMKPIARYKMFHIPLELSVSSMLRPGILAGARAEVGHIHYFTRQTALATIRHAGLTILDEHFTSVSIDHAVELKTKIARVPRQILGAVSKDFAARTLGGFSLFVLAE